MDRRTGRTFHFRLQQGVPAPRRWFALFILCFSLLAAPAITTLAATAKEGVELQKLQQEVRKLELENNRLASGWSLVIDLAPFLTALGALFGVLITLSKHLSEQNRQRSLDLGHLEAERKQRFNEKFSAIIESLGSRRVSIQASAAVSMLTFLRPDYEEFHEQVFMVLLANLKVHHNDVVQGLLIKAFERAIRLQAERIARENSKIEEKDDKVVLDMSECALEYINLSKVDLGWAHLKRSNLQEANLREATLFRVRGDKANFNGAKFSKALCKKARFPGAHFRDANLSAAILHSAHFESADMTNCRFQQAQLQGAHLEHATLLGARFEQADLNNAFFTDAKLDDIAKTSIVKSYNWRQAVFDTKLREELEEIEKQILAAKHPQHGQAPS